MVVGSISERERPAMGIKCKWGLQHVALFNRGPLTKGLILRPFASCTSVQCTLSTVYE